MALKIRKLHPSIGAEVSGIDLGQEISPENVKGLRAALRDNKVLFFRDQPLKPKDQIALGSVFGDLEPPHPIFPNIEGAEQVSVLEHDPDRPPQENEYHTDVTWREEPAMGSVLHAVEVPEIGGDTIFVDLEAVYRAFARPVQEMLCKLSAWHSIEVFANSVNYEKGADPDKFREILKQFPPQKHPLVRTHPETAHPCIYVNRIFTTRIDGLSRWESDHILKMIYAVAERPEYQYRFKWTSGATAIWDNRCTHHYAIADYLPNFRKMHRVTIKGSAPYCAMAEAAE